MSWIMARRLTRVSCLRSRVRWVQRFWRRMRIRRLRWGIRVLGVCWGQMRSWRGLRGLSSWSLWPGWRLRPVWRGGRPTSNAWTKCTLAKKPKKDASNKNCSEQRTNLPSPRPNNSTWQRLKAASLTMNHNPWPPETHQISKLSSRKTPKAPSW